MSFRDTTEIEKILAEYHARDEAGGEGHESTEDLIRKAYTAGLRRAQELANGLVFKTAGGALRIAPSALNLAIDAEVAKEGK
jgi:hypothetical protein